MGQKLASEKNENSKESKFRQWQEKEYVTQNHELSELKGTLKKKVFIALIHGWGAFGLWAIYDP